MSAFSSEQLNFFKFSCIVLDEFPVALRQVFVHMWDNQIALKTGIPKWDDSPAVRNLFLHKEGGKTKYVPTSKSYHEWDCTALFEATLYAQSFAMPDGSGGFANLDKLYVKPRCLPRESFHPSISSPLGNQAETFALALDQLRLLRNTLCHQISTQKIDKTTFDHYILLAKDAFVALGQDTTKIEHIGKLEEEDLPTAKLQRLEGELKKEKDAAIKLGQITDQLKQIASQTVAVGSDIKTAVENARVDVRSDLKQAVDNVTTHMEHVGLDVKDIRRKVETFNTDLSEVKGNVNDVKKAMQTGVSNGKPKIFVSSPKIVFTS